MDYLPYNQEYLLVGLPSKTCSHKLPKDHSDSTDDELQHLPTRPKLKKKHPNIYSSKPRPSNALCELPLNANIKSSKYKTQLCRNFSQTGQCPYRHKCQYAHGLAELQEDSSQTDHSHKCAKLRKCRPFTEQGFCNYGQRCQFIHHEVKEQTRLYLKAVKESMFAAWEWHPAYSRVLGMVAQETSKLPSF